MEQLSAAKESKKNEATARILTLLKILQAREDLTRDEIFAQMPSYYIQRENGREQTGDRKFERDLTFLQSQGFHITKKKVLGSRVRYTLERGSRDTLLLATQPELDALILLLNMFSDPVKYTPVNTPTQPLPVASPRTPFAENTLQLLSHIISLLPDEQKKQVERGIRKPFLYFNFPTLEDYLPHRITIERLIEAISWRRQIQFAYLPMHREQDVIQHDLIDPYYISYLDGHFYLIAFNHKVQKFHEYRIDRIQAESLRLLHTLIDVYRSQHPVEFSYWISGDIAKRGLSDRWLWQSIEKEEPVEVRGRKTFRVLVRAAAYGSWRVMQQMLKYGDQAELVDPPYLRDEMRKIVTRMYQAYQTESSSTEAENISDLSLMNNS